MCLVIVLRGNVNSWRRPAAKCMGKCGSTVATCLATSGSPHSRARPMLATDSFIPWKLPLSQPCRLGTMPCVPAACFLSFARSYYLLSAVWCRLWNEVWIAIWYCTVFSAVFSWNACRFAPEHMNNFMPTWLPWRWTGKEGNKNATAVLAWCSLLQVWLLCSSHTHICRLSVSSMCGKQINICDFVICKRTLKRAQRLAVWLSIDVQIKCIPYKRPYITASYLLHA